MAPKPQLLGGFMGATSLISPHGDGWEICRAQPVGLLTVMEKGRGLATETGGKGAGHTFKKEWQERHKLIKNDLEPQNNPLLPVSKLMTLPQAPRRFQVWT